MWSTAGTASELAFIRHVLELQIEYYNAFGQYPSPKEIQRQLHGAPATINPPPHFMPPES